MVDILFVSMIVLSFAMSFSIGANDAANALGTSYGSNAAQLWILLTLGAIFEFIGAVFCSQKLAGSLAVKVIPQIVTLSQSEQERMMCGCSLAAFVFIIGASYKGMPISGTHTVIGALIGSGIAGVGVGGIGWNKLVRVIMSWFISPLVAMAISSSLFMIVCSTTLGGCFTSLRVRIFSLYLISAVSFAFVAFMLINISTKRPNPQLFWLLPIFSVFGVIACKAVLVKTLRRISGEHNRENALISEVYRYLMVFAACLVCLAHGSNDVANSISPLLLVMQVEEKSNLWAYFLGGSGISLGLLILGQNVMQTVGKEVIKLDFQKGFCCQFATATSIILGTNFGLPLSTTHCMVGSLAGIILVGQFGVVKQAYSFNSRESELREVFVANLKTTDEELQTEAEAEFKDENSVFNKEKVKQIVAFWLMTVPVAFTFSYVITKLLLML